MSGVKWGRGLEENLNSMSVKEKEKLSYSEIRIKWVIPNIFENK
jgi:hypothetical protein